MCNLCSCGLVVFSDAICITRSDGIIPVVGSYHERIGSFYVSWSMEMRKLSNPGGEPEKSSNPLETIRTIRIVFLTLVQVNMRII